MAMEGSAGAAPAPAPAGEGVAGTALMGLLEATGAAGGAGVADEADAGVDGALAGVDADAAAVLGWRKG